MNCARYSSDRFIGLGQLLAPPADDSTSFLTQLAVHSYRLQQMVIIEVLILFQKHGQAHPILPVSCNDPFGFEQALSQDSPPKHRCSSAACRGSAALRGMGRANANLCDIRKEGAERLTAIGRFLPLATGSSWPGVASSNGLE